MATKATPPVLDPPGETLPPEPPVSEEPAIPAGSPLARLGAMLNPKAQDKRGPVTIAPKTAEMEAFLQAGYPGMTVEKAKTIIKERRENPALWPYEMFEKAQAFLAAYEAKPTAVSTRKPWKRNKVPA